MLSTNPSIVPEQSIGQYFDRLTPGRALAGSYLFWLLMFIIAPVDPRWSDVITGYFLIFLGLAGLAIGCSIPDTLKIRPNAVHFKEQTCKNAVLICAFLGILGLGFKLYDTFVLRGITLDQDVITNRIASARAEASGISILAAMFLPFANAALLIAWYSKRMGYVRRIGFWPIAASLAPIALPFLLGSRSGLIYFMAIFVAAYLNLAPNVRARHFALAFIAMLAVLSLFALVFVNRVEASGQSLLYAARLSVYTQVVPLQTWALNYIDNAGEFAPLLAGYASIMQYILSGMFEFLYLVELKDDNFALGTNTFFFLPKFWNLITGSADTTAGQAAIIGLNPRVGVFQTFFGGLYIDFGLFVPIFSLLLGYCIAMLRAFVRAGNVFAFPLYALFLSQLLLASMLDSLTGSAAILSNLMYLFIFIAGSAYRAK